MPGTWSWFQVLVVLLVSALVMPCCVARWRAGAADVYSITLC